MLIYKNISEESYNLMGVSFAPNDTYVITDQESLNWASSSDVMHKILDGEGQIGNGEIFIENITEQLKWLISGTAKVTLNHNSYENRLFVETHYGLHATNHEVGGSDELDVTGLSGILADPQHVDEEEVLSTIGDLTKEPTGFVCTTGLENIGVTYTIDGDSGYITLSGTFEAYYRGVKITALIDAWQSDNHPANPTIPLYLKYGSNGFEWSIYPWSFDELQIAYVCYKSDGNFYFAQREVHGLMPWEVHKAFHETIGTYRESGGGLQNYTLQNTTASLRRPDVQDINIADEDLITSIDGLDSKLYTRCFINGDGNNQCTLEAADIVFLDGSNIPRFNSITDGIGTQVPMNEINRDTYMSVWVIAIPVTDDSESQKFRFIFKQGQSRGIGDIGLTEQRNLQPQDLYLGDLEDMSPEFVFTDKIIIRYRGNPTNNWDIYEVQPLTGNRFIQVGNPAGTYLSLVSTDTTLTGDGTVANPLTLATTNHNDFTLRDVDDAHPISAITNLQDTLDNFDEVHGSGLISGGTITVTSANEFSVAAGSGYLVDSTTGKFKKVTWSLTEDIAVIGGGANYVRINNNGQIDLTLDSSFNLYNYIELGYVFAGIGGTQIIDIAPTPSWIFQHNTKVNSFLRRGIKTLVNYGLGVSEGSTPFTLNIGSGEIFAFLNEITFDSSTTFVKLYWTSDLELVPKTSAPLNTLEPGYWNDITKTYAEGALIPMTTGYFKTDLIFKNASGQNYVFYGQQEYATLEEAREGALAHIPDMLTNVVALLAKIHMQEGSSSILDGGEIVDIRPNFSRIFGYGTAAAAAVQEHSSLTGLGNDDHTQYYNETRGDARYYKIDDVAFTDLNDVDDTNKAEGKIITVNSTGDHIYTTFNPYPIGSTYIQFEDLYLDVTTWKTNGFGATEEPSVLFGGTWDTLVDDEAVFFRTEGTHLESSQNTNRVNGKQTDQMQDHKHNLGVRDANGNSNSPVDRVLARDTSWTGYTYSTSIADGIANATAITSPIANGTNGTPRVGKETYPVNRLFRIWKRYS